MPDSKTRPTVSHRVHTQLSATGHTPARSARTPGAAVPQWGHGNFGE
ncbi:hypothetical protein [Bifidobacterium pseudolongum]|nr:hypothetical protein [Bifidobacterium pseudolongum]MDY3689385.1 hypothetical protein [Bifidobacterium pseudolongum]UNP91015.1 hypothetical protein MPY69_06130 [Bifidobacterium pseudolongum subsp. pseudolongum]WCA41276.1 hypothetical protein PGB23_02315 [Bifidobacterium pseudolongum subsp. pseudolongum]